MFIPSALDSQKVFVAHTEYARTAHESIADVQHGLKSSPCGGEAGIEKLALSAFGGLTFATRRHSGRRPVTPGGLLPSTSGSHGKVRAGWGVGAAGVFFSEHECSFVRSSSFLNSN